MLLDNYKKESPIIGVAGMGGGINSYIFLSSGGGYVISRSLRFNSGDSAYLNRTPSSAGNRKTWTWSAWVKRSGIGANDNLFRVAGSSSKATQFSITIHNGNYVSIDYGGAFYLRSTRLLRDPSAWQHWVVSVDTTNSTANNRIRLYINGVEETEFDTRNNPDQNEDLGINRASEHTISSNDSNGLDGYLADVHFIDGQALAPTDFGETDDNGVWQAKEFAGTYTVSASGIVYSNALTASTLKTIADGFNGLTTGRSEGVGGLTFTPVGGIAYTSSVEVYDGNNVTKSQVNGGTFVQHSTNNWVTVASGSGTLNTLYSVRTDNASWDAGFQAIRVDGVILTDGTTAQGANSFHLDFKDNSSNAALGYDSSGVGNNWTVNNFSGPGSDYDYASMVSHQANNGYHSGAGPEKAFDGLTTTAPRTNASNNNGNITFTPSPSISHTTLVRAYWQHGNVSATYSYNGGSATSITSSGWITLASGSGTFTSLNTNRDGDGNYFSAIEVDGTVLLTSTGANNDSLVDSPTNGTTSSGGDPGGSIVGNYATWNPLDQSGITFSNGNLDTTGSGRCKATIGLASGKWYWEQTVVTKSAEQYLNPRGGVTTSSASLAADLGSDAGHWALFINSGTDGGKGYHSSSKTGSATAFSLNDVAMFAYDADAGNLWFGRNGTWITGNPATGSTPFYSGITAPVFPILQEGASSSVTNFGQRAFHTAAPAGYKSLNTANLTPPTIADGSQYFDARSGLTAQFTISDLNFATGLMVAKSTSNDEYWIVADVVRNNFVGPLRFNDTNAEGTGAAITNVSATGYQSDSNWFSGGRTYATFNWDAGSSTVTNPNGSIPSQVRANPSAGFSIVTYTGTGADASVGHGLNDEPHLIFTKNRDASNYGWYTYAKAIGNDKYLVLEDTIAATSFNLWQNTTATSSVFYLSSSAAVMQTDADYVAYCFSPVAGYSAMGSYTGNGSATDGPFVSLSFRPAFLMIKNAGQANSWFIIDTKVNTYNVVGDYLFADQSAAESSFAWVDILSNGFKLRSTGTGNNNSGIQYLYIAFAENPFQANGGLAR